MAITEGGSHHKIASSGHITSSHGQRETNALLLIDRYLSQLESSWPISSGPLYYKMVLPTPGWSYMLQLITKTIPLYWAVLHINLTQARRSLS